MRRKSILKRLLALILVFPLAFSIYTAIAADINDVSGLGDMRRYNGIIFDYFESYSADVEGALAVGGKSRIGTSGQYDMGAAAYPGYIVMGQYQNDGYPTLVVGDEPTIGKDGKSGWVGVYGGPAVLPERLRSYYIGHGNKFGGTVKYATDRAVDDFFTGSYNTAIHTVNALAAANTKSGSSIAFSAFGGNTAPYQTTFADLSRFEPNNLSGQGLGKVAVINVTDKVVQINAPKITDALGEYDLIVFNFPNATDPTFTGGSLSVGGKSLNTSASKTYNPTENARLAKYAAKVIWNFPKAETVQVSGCGVVGSVFAPHALLDANGGSINGMLIAGSFLTKNGMELHAFRVGKPVFDIDGNTVTEGRVVLYKYDEANSTSFDDYELLAGAVFQLYKKDAGGTYQPYGAPRTVGPDGRLRWPEPGQTDYLGEGSYFFREISPPEGYYGAGGDIPFEIKAGSTTDTPVYLYVPNTPYTTGFSLRKIEQGVPGTGLPGAVFELYLANLSTYMAPMLIATEEVDQYGELTFTGLQEGRYLLVEKQAPEGYEIDFRPIIINIDFDSGGTATITHRFLEDPSGSEQTLSPGSFLELENKPITNTTDYFAVMLAKVVEGREDIPIEGAEFKLYLYNDSTQDYTDFVGDYVTDELGHISDTLEKGKYKLIETASPPGFDFDPLNPTTLRFEVPMPVMPFGAPITTPFLTPAGGDEEGGEEDGENEGEAQTEQDNTADQDAAPEAPTGDAPPAGDADADSSPDDQTAGESAADPATNQTEGSGDTTGSPGGDDSTPDPASTPDSTDGDTDTAAAPLAIDLRVELYGDGEAGGDENADGGPLPDPPAPPQEPSSDPPPQADGANAGPPGPQADPTNTGPQNDPTNADPPPGPASDPPDGGVPQDPPDEPGGPDGTGDNDATTPAIPPTTGGDGDGGTGREAETDDDDSGDDDETDPLLQAAPPIRPAAGPFDSWGIYHTMTNRAIGEIVVEKRDDQTGKLLPGATFALYYNLGTTDPQMIAGRWVRVDAATTGSGGTVTFSGLWPGEYRVMETDAPDGYADITSPEPVPRADDEDLFTATIGGAAGDFAFAFVAHNPRTQGSIQIKKVDGDTLQSLPGASFNLTYWDDDDHAWKPYPQYSHTTDANGRIEIGGLPFGRYKIIEMRPPDGYALETEYDRNELIFTITHNGVYADGEITVANYKRTEQGDDDDDDDATVTPPPPGSSGGGGSGGSGGGTSERDRDIDRGVDRMVDTPDQSTEEILSWVPTSQGDNPFNPGTGYLPPLMRTIAYILSPCMLLFAVVLHIRGKRWD